MKLSDSACIFLCAATGGILFSQGLSFARWNAYQGISYFINFHALLLAAGGLGLLAIGRALKALVDRVETLEKRLRDFTPQV